MDATFELVEGYLAHDRVDHILGLLRQHGLALALVFRALQKRTEGQHFAEHGCGFSKRQWR